MRLPIPRSASLHRHVGVAILLALHGFHRAPLQAAPAVQDYSQGFARLHELGLPVATGATYVALSSHYDPLFSGREFKGNAWLLRASGSNATFIVHQKQVVEYRRDGSEPDGVRSWRPADLDADVKALAQKLERGELRNMDPFSGGPVSPTETILFFSAHLHAVGKRAEANALVAKLFTDPAMATATLAGALNGLADLRYEAALASFSKTNDWASLRDTVAKLRTQFGLRWEMDAGAAILLEKLDARVKGVHELAGDGIPDAQRALARELAETGWDEAITMRSGFWLLTRTKEEPSTTPHTLADRVLGGGVETLPLLIALADDETLTPRIHYSEYYRWAMHGYGGGRKADDHGKFVYETMPRPQTRGELAMGLLQRVVPDSGRSERRRGGESEPAKEEPLKQRAATLYAQLRGKDMAGIVQFYLTHESEAARRQMLAALVGRPDAVVYNQGIETALLAMDASELHTSYLAERGEAVRPFAAQLLAATRKRLAELRKPPPAAADDGDDALFRESSGDDDTKQRIAELASACNELQEFVSDKPLEERLKEISTGGSTKSLPASFYKRVAKRAPHTTLPTILKAAATAPTGEGAIKVLSIGERVSEGWRQGFEDGEGDPFAIRMSTPKPIYDPAPDRALWDAILADSRTHFSGDGSRLDDASVAARALPLLETLCRRVEDDWPEPPEDVERLPVERRNRIAVAGARAILEGRPPEAMPEPEEPAGRAVAARLATVETDEVPKFLESLSNNEYLALVQRAKDDADVRARFAPLATTLRRFEGAPEGFPLTAGTRLTVDSVQAVVDWSKAAARDGKALSICLTRNESAADGFSGSSAPVSKDDRRVYSGDSDDAGPPTATVYAYLVGPDSPSYATWRVATHAKPAPAADPEVLSVLTDMRRAQEFWKAAETVLTNKDSDPFSRVALRVMVLPPKDPKDSKDDEEEDEDGIPLDILADPFEPF